jgi:hypothetical protein
MLGKHYLQILNFYKTLSTLILIRYPSVSVD